MRSTAATDIRSREPGFQRPAHQESAMSDCVCRPAPLYAGNDWRRGWHGTPVTICIWGGTDNRTGCPYAAGTRGRVQARSIRRTVRSPLASCRCATRTTWGKLSVPPNTRSRIVTSVEPHTNAQLDMGTHFAILDRPIEFRRDLRPDTAPEAAGPTHPFPRDDRSRQNPTRNGLYFRIQEPERSFLSRRGWTMLEWRRGGFPIPVGAWSTR